MLIITRESATNTQSQSLFSPLAFSSPLSKPQHTTFSSPSLSICVPSSPKSQDIAVSQNSNIMGFKTVYKCLTEVFPQVDRLFLPFPGSLQFLVLPVRIPSPSLPSDGENEQEKETGLRRQQFNSSRRESGSTYSFTICLVQVRLPDFCQPVWDRKMVNCVAAGLSQRVIGKLSMVLRMKIVISQIFPGDSENMNSKQLGQIELLEENVEAAKDNKKTLFLEMESVMILMKEAELKEMAAEQAKDEAARGGLDILIKVEELKQMLVRAKEANGMHAGEVYGEKAILATEVRELQARLLSLSDEKDNALAILDEMRQTLKSRQAAQNALEAEENAKLREFLMDRGCVVDTLQGEISVICQDVRLLKEKFDERVPLSKSVSSSQTSCILASSGTSVKSLASDLGAEIGETSELPKEPVLACSADDVQSPELHHESVERASSDKKQL
ncbi:hypothetical protein OIU84_016558, partial [Salix udensis]